MSTPNESGSEEFEQGQTIEEDQEAEQQSEENALSNVDDSEEEEDTPRIVRGRGRGRPRGRPRGSRARGGGRGVGRGRKSGISITLKNPNFIAATPDDSDRDGELTNASTPAMDADEEEGNASDQKMYRTVDSVEYEFNGEELLLPEDPNGETKIDKLGNLLGGRTWKGSTFTSAIRPNPNKRYILSIEAARATGYRDSLYYFRRNPLLIKLTVSQSEKEILIAEKILSQNLRSRIVTMVTARSAFMVGGAKLIRDGKWVDDDYYEDKAREECLEKGLRPGDPVGEVGDNTFGDRDESAIRKQLQATSLASTDRSSAVYKTGGPTTFFGQAGLGPFAGEMSSSRKAALSRDGVTEENWMALASTGVHEANEEYAKMRKQRLYPGGATDATAGTNVASVTSGKPQPSTTSLLATLPRGSTPQIKQSERSTPAPPTENPPIEEKPISIEGLSLAALRALNLKRPGFTINGSPIKKKPKQMVKVEVDQRVKSVYEPHTGLTHYPVNTQATYSRMELLSGPDDSDKFVLGGSLTGSGAWGVAWVDTVAEFRDFETEKHQEMAALRASLDS
ncbi:hypothetical protein FRC03_002858 [Tulasnella sp. 419]|nr:hypothetical protein FRC03_002858 [Tulasnella sp. 419]